MKKEALIGIDIGSTSVRCCLFDLDFNQLHMINKPTQLVFTKFGQDSKRTDIAWDAGKLWALVHSELSELSTFVEGNHIHVVGVAISSVGCSPVFLDQKGEVLYPIFRHFTRPSALLSKMMSAYGSNRFRNITGYPLAPTSTAFLISHLREITPNVFNKIAHVIPVSNFIAYQLTHEVTTDLSIGASFGFWDHNHASWWKPYLSEVNLIDENFGRFVNGGLFIGKIRPSLSKSTTVLHGIPVYSGGHDYLCAALAAGCNTEDQLFNIDGTFEISATFSRNLVRRSPDDKSRSIIDINVIPDSYSFMVERIGSGQVDWVANLLYRGDWGEIPWEEVFPKTLGKQDLLIGYEFFIPYVYGRIFPEFNEDVSGGFFGLNQHTSRSKLMRSAILSSCFESKRMFDYQKKIRQKDFCKIISVGGATRNKEWVQLKANIIGKEIHVPSIEQPTSLGAAMLAAIGSGVYHSIDETVRASQRLGGNSYLPDMYLHSLYSEYFEHTYLPLVKKFEELDQFNRKKRD